MRPFPDYDDHGRSELAEIRCIGATAEEFRVPLGYLPKFKLALVLVAVPISTLSGGGVGGSADARPGEVAIVIVRPT